MVKSLFFFLILLFFTFFSDIVFTSSWPIKDITVSNFTSFFGESRGEHFHNGVDISKKDAKVYPSDRGEILFYYDEDELTKSTLGLGKYVIIENYIYRSYYCHLDKLGVKNKILVDKKEFIGFIGNTGRSSGQHLHFAIKKDGFFIDPFDIIKEKLDNLGSELLIETVFFKSGYYNNFVKKDEYNLTLPFREIFDIYIYARSSGQGSIFRGIKSVKIEIRDSNNNLVFSNFISFDYIDNDKINSKYNIDELYYKIWGKNYIYLGRWIKKIRKEKYFIFITVKDHFNSVKDIRKEVIFK